MKGPSKGYKGPHRRPKFRMQGAPHKVSMGPRIQIVDYGPAPSKYRNQKNGIKRRKDADDYQSDN